jgi:hypothetical protein
MTYTDNNPLEGENCYQVQAFDEAGNLSELSEEVCVDQSVDVVGVILLSVVLLAVILIAIWKK